MPVTFTKSNLCVTLSDGKTIFGETHIDVLDKRDKRAKIVKAYLSPEAEINEDAKDAILSADYILIGPGDLYTSIIPNLLVKGATAAIKKSKAKKIYVLNLMTKYGQTTDYKASDHLGVLEEYLGKGVVDYVLVNSRLPKQQVLSWYEEYHEQPVEDDLPDNSKYKIIRKDLIKDVVITKDENDQLRRSLIRHDSEKLATEIMDLIANS